jgi:HEAT repeat protein
MIKTARISMAIRGVKWCLAGLLTLGMIGLMGCNRERITNRDRTPPEQAAGAIKLLSAQDCQELAVKSLNTLKDRPGDQTTIDKSVKTLQSVCRFASKEIIAAMSEAKFPHKKSIVEIVAKSDMPQRIEGILIALGDRDSAVRLKALMSIESGMNPRFEEPLLRLAKSPNRWEREWAIHDLGILGSPNCIEAAKRGLSDENIHVRMAGLNALARTENPAYANLIKHLVKDPNILVRVAAHRALSMVSPADPLLTHWFADLRSGWPKYSINQKLSVIHTLIASRSKGISWLQSSALEDKSREIRLVFLSTCDRYRHLDAPTLERYIQRETDTKLREQAIILFWSRDPVAALKYVKDLLGHSASSTIYVMELGKAKKSEAIPLLKPFLRSETRLEAALALSALGVPGAELEGVPDELSKSFLSKPGIERERIVLLIYTSGTEASWARDILTMAQRDPIEEVRIYACKI